MPLLSSFAGRGPLSFPGPFVDEPIDDSLHTLFARLASEAGADAVVLGIDLGHGYRQHTLRTDENLPGKLSLFELPSANGYTCHIQPLSCGTARRREAPRSSIALLRARGKPDFDIACRSRLALILPYVEHAVVLGCALENSQQIHHGTRLLLEASGEATILLRSDGRVLQASTRACALLEAAHARFDDRLILPDAGLQYRYEDLLRKSRCQTADTPLYLDLPPALRLVLRPIREQPELWVLSVQPQGSLGPASEFVARYRLTPCEFKLGQALASGLSLKECACRWNRSYETLRGQLKILFSKTGCHRQAELVALYRDHLTD